MQAEARSRVNLKQLVASSLEAVTEANTSMSRSMIDTILKFSDNKGHDNDGYPIVQLKTLQLVYDQMRHDDLDMLCTEKVGLEIPMLSIIPLSNLRVSKSKICFSAEVQELETSGSKVNIYTRVASPDSDRSAKSSRMDFEIELESDPAAEGLARVVDQLSQNFIPTVHDKYPVDPDGDELTEEETADYEVKKELRGRERRLSRLIAQLNDIQRMDEDKDDDESRVSIYKDLEPYKEDLEQRLALARKELLQHDIQRELARENKGDETDPMKPEERNNDNRKT